MSKQDQIFITKRLKRYGAYSFPKINKNPRKLTSTIQLERTTLVQFEIDMSLTITLIKLLPLGSTFGLILRYKQFHHIHFLRLEIG